MNDYDVKGKSQSVRVGFERIGKGMKKTGKGLFSFFNVLVKNINSLSREHFIFRDYVYELMEMNNLPIDEKSVDKMVEVAEDLSYDIDRSSIDIVNMLVNVVRPGLLGVSLKGKIDGE